MSELNEKTPLLEVRNLRKLFPGKSSFMKKDKAWIKAVDGVSFKLDAKETLGVVGESGCGKSTMGRSVLRLIEPTEGEILYKGKDFTKASGQELRKMRADMQIIFQDPYASLNPRMTVGEIIAEPLNIQKRYKTKEETRAHVLKVLEVVGLNTKYYNRYPHEFSGGMRQRVMIAMALACNPRLVIADEPTTALDVTIQSQILELINKLKEERKLSVIFITHDLGVVANMADKIAVMYAGKIVEYGTADDIFYDSRHPYTWALLSSMPDLDTDEKLDAIPGTPPNMIYPPVGDAFAERNKYALKIDFEMEPPKFEVSPTHWAATWLLHPDAPKVPVPKAITDRIQRMKKLGGAEHGEQ